MQLRPLAAMVQDVIAHTFFELQHTATVHYENGHYHLHKELKDISEEENNPVSEKSSQKTGEAISNHIPQKNEFIFAQSKTTALTPTSFQEKCLNTFIKISSPPPKP
jgi:hypothetical protein